ncbi:DUF5689 domain-containing protein [Flavimarina sp. Hel_I_48]|uniref:DUF5689 domain-containing protein n=1 Tax=Flavimarina sp. Hel_I_48 TaxID=1392488 RepID=UPI00068D8939|nr:DUF5689 domain-containing protein [Flavimarina sp. Hel_I_48]
MKNFKPTFLLLLLILTCAGCVHDDDFEVPEINTEEVEISANFSIAKAKEFYRGFDPVLINAGPNADAPLYVEGYVVSSDESGNFFRTLIIQDKPENPTSAIAISTDATDVYTLFEPGRKVLVRVDGLYSGEFAGLPTIGLQGEGGSGDVGRISTGEFDERVLRTNTTATLIPLVIAINDVAEKYLNMLVQFDNVQIPEEELGESYANINNTYGVDRALANCAGDQVILRTSGYAAFKNLELPAGNGSIITILGKFNANFQVYIRDLEDVAMDGERCK